MATSIGTIELYADSKKTTVNEELTKITTAYQDTGSTLSLMQEALIIEVQDKDETEEVFNSCMGALSKFERPWTALSLKGETSTPELLSYVPRKEIIAGARNSGILNNNRFAHITAIIASLICSVGFYLCITTDLWPSFLLNTPQFVLDNPVFLSVLTAILIWLMVRKTQQVFECRNKKLLTQILSFLKTTNITDKRYSSYINYMVDVVLMVIERPLVIIIKDYSMLDIFTQAVLKIAMNPPDRSYFGAVLWIVHETKADELSTSDRTQSVFPRSSFRGRCHVASTSSRSA